MATEKGVKDKTITKEPSRRQEAERTDRKATPQPRPSNDTHEETLRQDTSKAREHLASGGTIEVDQRGKHTYTNKTK